MGLTECAIWILDGRPLRIVAVGDVIFLSTSACTVVNCGALVNQSRRRLVQVYHAINVRAAYQPASHPALRFIQILVQYRNQASLVSCSIIVSKPRRIAVHCRATTGAAARPHHLSAMSQSKPPPPSSAVNPPIPPQHLAPFQAAWERHAPVSDPSVRHPVFFTPRLMRPPQPQPGLQSQHGPTVALSPVAHGYVYQSGQQKAPMGKPKL